MYTKLIIFSRKSVHLRDRNPNMYNRSLHGRLEFLSSKYQVITLTGARQSGKTTLVRHVFSDYSYFSLENPSIRQIALEDPEAFLSQGDHRMVLDEVQNSPELFSYIQGIVDRNAHAQYILTGSQNFLLLESVSQSLAGRAAVLHLHPLTWNEMSDAGILDDKVENVIWKGCYPGIFQRELNPADFYPYYVNTYLERDVRTLRNPADLGLFQRFMQLLAGRVGHVLNYSDIARDLGVSPKTVQAWIFVLQQSHLVILLQPYFRNYQKRVIKSPKVYITDTGLLCHLLSIHSADQLITHYAYGEIFENAIIAEWYKNKYHLDLNTGLYFWRDNHGDEIDLLIDSGDRLTPVEIKSSKTIRKDFMKAVNKMTKLAGLPDDSGYVIYGGQETLSMKSLRSLPWIALSKETYFTS